MKNSFATNKQGVYLTQTICFN